MSHNLFPSRLRRTGLWLAVAVVFGGLLLGKYIIADRLLAVRLVAAPAAGPVAASARVIIEERDPWNQAPSLSIATEPRGMTVPRARPAGPAARRATAPSAPVA